jgi:hypothetical protein
MASRVLWFAPRDIPRRESSPDKSEIRAQRGQRSPEGSTAVPARGPAAAGDPGVVVGAPLRCRQAKLCHHGLTADGAVWRSSERDEPGSSPRAWCFAANA